jgi:hypothetical protein
MPLRLGGGLDGWSPGQHARMSADAVCAGRIAPLARLRMGVGAGGLVDYLAQHDMATLPTVAVVGGGISQITWPTSVADTLGAMAPVNIKHARAKAVRTVAVPECATVRIISPTTILVYTWQFIVGAWGAANGIADLVVY